MKIEGVVDRLIASPLVDLVSPVVVGEVGTDGGWVVGGAVRDVLLDRPVGDLDLAVDAEPGPVAAAIAGVTGGVAFELSDEFATWRVVDRAGEWQVDVARLRAPSIEGDLAARDFSVGAIAVPLSGSSLIDPFGGVADLEGGLIRAVSPDSFSADPLRILRAARLSAQFGWVVDEGSVELARGSADSLGRTAGERILTEFLLLVGSRDPLAGVEALDTLGALPVVFPELDHLRGVTQGPNHHLDVYGHTIEVLEGVLRIESELDRFVGDLAGPVAELLAEPLADGIDRAVGLRLGALFHDCAKPETRNERDGFVGFRGHDVQGAGTVKSVFGERLRASRKLTSHVADLTLHHLALGFMVHDRPLAPEQVFRYLKTTSPVTVDVTLLTIADRLAARGTGPVAAPEMVAAHIELAAEMVEAGLRWHREGPPELPIPGDLLAAEVGIEPGPELGRLIDQLEEAVYAGRIETANDAVDLGRRILRER